MGDLVYIVSNTWEAAAVSSGGRGATFTVAVGTEVFAVRQFCDSPNQCQVVNPPGADQLPQARQLVSYLTSVLGFQQVSFTADTRPLPQRATATFRKDAKAPATRRGVEFPNIFESTVPVRAQAV